MKSKLLSLFVIVLVFSSMILSKKTKKHKSKLNKDKSKFNREINLSQHLNFLSKIFNKNLKEKNKQKNQPKNLKKIIQKT